jgi:hypothetical protein
MATKSTVGALFGCLFWLALIAFIVCLGPMALAYDLNHLVPLATHQPLAVKWSSLAIFIAGIFLSEVAIPVALFVWVLVTIGVLS